MSPLAPLKHALAAVMATTHDALAALGVSADSAVTWVVGIASLVVLVRLLLLPFVIHGVRQAHAGARARPHLKGITERYRGRTDAESLRAHMDERRARVRRARGQPPRLPAGAGAAAGVARALPPRLRRGPRHGRRRDGTRAGVVVRCRLPRRRLARRPRLPRLRWPPPRRRGRARADRGRAVVRHPAVRGRAQHVRRGHAGGDGRGAAHHARDVGRRDAARRRRGAGGTARLLGVQLDVDARPVGGDRTLVAHPGTAAAARHVMA